jgi:DNA-binding NarL/FixJ family response regulator
MIRVLTVDDHTIFRSGLQRMLQDEPDMCADAQARNGAEAIELLARQPFDVVLMDINMDGRSGIEVVSGVRSQGCKVPILMLSMHPEEQYALLAVQAGANGYVKKDAAPGELIAAIRIVANGGNYLSSVAALSVHAQLGGKDNRPAHQKLSVRESQIMRMLVKGVSQIEIAREMMISPKTVNSHRTNLMEKLGISNNSELVMYAVRNGLSE